jgi:hypothetical protein
MQIVCSGECGLAYARKLRTKAEAKAKRAERVETKAKLDTLKPISHWIAATQEVFNTWVRTRDAKLPCISCGIAFGAWDAGHYRTTAAAPELRFDPANVHKQCVQCNQTKHGNAIEMRRGMVARIGLAEVERLEGPHPPHKPTREELEALRAHYRAKTKELQCTPRS